MKWEWSGVECTSTAITSSTHSLAFSSFNSRCRRTWFVCICCCCYYYYYHHIRARKPTASLSVLAATSSSQTVVFFFFFFLHQELSSFLVWKRRISNSCYWVAEPPMQLMIGLLSVLLGESRTWLGSAPLPVHVRSRVAVLTTGNLNANIFAKSDKSELGKKNIFKCPCLCK